MIAAVRDHCVGVERGRGKRSGIGGLRNCFRASLPPPARDFGLRPTPKIPAAGEKKPLVPTV